MRCTTSQKLARLGSGLSAVVLCVLLMCLSATPAAGTTVADSVTEFSGIQGQNNWYYGYWNNDGSYAASEFVPLPSFNGSGWVGPYTSYQLPNLTSVGGHPYVGAWAVRRWVSEVSGQVTVSGVIASLDTRYGGDGIVGAIYKDGALDYSQYIAPRNDVGVAYSRILTVNVGSIIDFVITPNVGQDYDTAKFTASIEQTSSVVPEPLTITGLFLAVGGLGGYIRRRRMAAK